MVKTNRVYIHRYVPVKCRGKKVGKGVPTPYMGGAVPAPYFGGSRRGRGFGSWIKKLVSKIPKIRQYAKKAAPTLAKLAEMGIEQGSAYLSKKGTQALSKKGEALKKKLGSAYSPVIDAGQRLIKDKADKLLVAGKDFGKREVVDRLKNFGQGSGISLKRLAYPNLKGSGRMFSSVRRITAPYGGTILSGPIP